VNVTNIVKQLLSYKALAITVIGAAITLGAGALTDPVIRNLIADHPGVAAFFVAVYHVLLVVDRALGGNPPVAKNQ